MYYFQTWHWGRGALAASDIRVIGGYPDLLRDCQIPARRRNHRIPTP
jgi:hypothetical protein